MTTEKLSDDEIRSQLLRTGVHVVTALFYEAFNKPYNVIVIACPAGEKTVSCMSRCESDETLKGMTSVFMSTLDLKKPDGEALQ